MSETTCIIPWTNLVIDPDGRASFCCDVHDRLKDGDRYVSIYTDSIDDLWNAEQIVGVRAAMARGERPADCQNCWKVEDAGGNSRRTLINENYRLAGGVFDPATLPTVGADTGFRLAERPQWFVLELGNVCNLKCRTCSGTFSSLIKRDLVHSAWNGQSVNTRGDGTPAWFQDFEKLADLIASGAGQNAFLSLMGGEPFMIKPVWRLLRALTERGVAPNIIVGLATNGQHRSEELRELVSQFRTVELEVSIDATGRLFEYLRHGASWSKAVDNLRWFRSIPGLMVRAVPTLQNTNALSFTTLLRFLDDQGMLFAYNAIQAPRRLRASNLPEPVRRLAADRLRAYLADECRPENAAVVDAHIQTIERSDDQFDPDLFEEYMAFTNDLDQDRGEDIRRAAPELFSLIESAGIKWSEKRRHPNMLGLIPVEVRYAKPERAAPSGVH